LSDLLISNCDEFIYYDFRTFSQLLEDGQRRGLLQLERDERSGGYIIHLAAHDD
jgi:hypothetical protein